MLGNCILIPAAYWQLEEKYVDPCKHCINHQFGCPNKRPIRVGLEEFIPIEDNPSELPICGIWCRNCKGKTAKIQHEVLWHGRRAYAIKCPICNSEFLLYKDKVRSEYTGFRNLKGEFVKPDLYHKREAMLIGRLLNHDDAPETSHVASFGEEDGSSSAMSAALKKAGII